MQNGEDFKRQTKQNRKKRNMADGKRELKIFFTVPGQKSQLVINFYNF